MIPSASIRTEEADQIERGQYTVAPAADGKAVIAIRVRKLFGAYDYDIEPKTSSLNSITKVMVLYGDNGSGKTTLLTLLFHLLSPERNAGHRTAIGGVAFSEFSVRLSGGCTISAVRDNPVAGDYKLVIDSPGDEKVEASIEFDPQEGNLKAKSSQSLKVFLQYLQQVGTTAYFLSDDRNVVGEQGERRNRSDGDFTTTITEWSRIRGDAVIEEARTSRRKGPNPINVAVSESVEALNRDMRSEISDKMREGEASANAIYEQVVQDIIRPNASEGAISPNRSTKELSNVLTDLAAKLENAQNYSLGSPQPLRQIAALASAATLANEGILTQILEPYVSGLSARVEGLLSSVARFERLSAVATRFFNDKRVDITIDRGLRVLSNRTGKEISLPSLSSGEKQLLLILVRATSLGRKHRLFIIDEPEISLNVKWQRKLLTAITECMHGRSIQVITATHSIYMVTPVVDDVQKLTPLSE